MARENSGNKNRHSGGKRHAAGGRDGARNFTRGAGQGARRERDGAQRGERPERERGRGGFDRGERQERERQGRARGERDTRQGRRDFGHAERGERQGFQRGEHGARPERERGRRGVGRFGTDAENKFSRGKQQEARKGFGRGGTRGAGKSDRGGREREFSAAERLAHELRPVRKEHKDPEIPAEIQAKQLHPGARNELKTLEKDNADRVARHLVMAGELIHYDPELAHQHAISASRKAGRIPVVRETLAVTAYALGDFAMALRELRTYRRLSGRDNNIALMVDCERGLGRPERGLEIAREANLAHLNLDERVHLAIALSGARLDLGQLEKARSELEIAELNPGKAYPSSPELFGAYALVLSELGDPAAKKWQDLSERAEQALIAHQGGEDLIVTDALASKEELIARGIELEAEAEPAAAASEAKAQ